MICVVVPSINQRVLSNMDIIQRKLGDLQNNLSTVFALDDEEYDVAAAKRLVDELLGEVRIDERVDLMRQYDHNYVHINCWFCQGAAKTM